MLFSPGKASPISLFFVLILGIILGILTSFYIERPGSKRGDSISAKTEYPGSFEGFPQSFAELSEQVGTAVVNISTTKAVRRGDPFSEFQSPFDGFLGKEFWEFFFGKRPQQRKEKSLGSGFIVSKKGYIITNAHVVENAEDITIRLSSGKTHKAHVIGWDAKTDLALLKTENWFDLPDPAKLGDSDTLRVGDWVVAIGNPFGLDQTVTAGIVSAKGRVIGAGPYDDFIQTDASINPGNSGGPLFNVHGEVVGINTAIFTTTGGNIGIGFAIPINMARDVIKEIEKKARIPIGALELVLNN